MLLMLQIGLYCLLFFLLVKCAVRDDGMNCLYFYPKAYIEEAENVMDWLWVGRSPVWSIAGMEGVPYIKPWKDVLVKRSLGTFLLCRKYRYAIFPE